MRHNNKLKKIDLSASVRVPYAFKELLNVVTSSSILKVAGALIIRQPFPIVTQRLHLNPVCVNHGNEDVSFLTAGWHGLHTEFLQNTS